VELPAPSADNQFLHYVQHPEVARLLPVLYPGVFPNLAGLTAARADLVAILLIGIPAGIISGFQNFTGSTPADMLRLNMAIPPAANPNIFGILGGDLAGFPNGRRVADDVVAIELPGDSRGHLPPGQPELHARWRSVETHRRHNTSEQPDPVPAGLPLPRRARGRVQHPAPLAILSSGSAAVDQPRPDAGLSQGVVLDIGGDIGALVVHATAALRGREVEVSPVVAGTQRVHAVVHQRQAAGRPVFAAVFPSLAQGDYLLWDGERTLGRVTITGGQVTEAGWPFASRAVTATTQAPIRRPDFRAADVSHYIA
jgi:Domain of unknown function (DUF4331)